MWLHLYVRVCFQHESFIKYVLCVCVRMCAGGFSGAVGLDTPQILQKRRMLREEGVFFSSSGKLKVMCHRQVLMEIPPGQGTGGGPGTTQPAVISSSKGFLPSTDCPPPPQTEAEVMGDDH